MFRSGCRDVGLLEHEARHLARLSIGGAVVVEDGHVGGTLQQAVEVVTVDGHLVVDGGQSVGLANRIRNEGGVADAARHIALVA